MSRSKAEFQAILLAGGEGSHLMPLTEMIPKCMLPIINIPLIRYSLELLELNGFYDIIIVTQKSQLSLIEYVDTYMGTAEVLKHIKHLITTDFLVVSGDLITNAPISLLADVHRINDSTCSILVSSTPVEAAPVEIKGKKKKEKEKDKIEELEKIDLYLMGLAPADNIDSLPANRLVVFNAAGDCETCRISKNMLKQFPRFNLRPNLRDAHLYLFSHWVLDLLVAQPQIESIQGDLIPYLVKKQFDTDVLKVEIPQPKFESSYKISSYRPDTISCFAVTCPPEFFCQRVTTIPNFIKTSRKVASGELPIFSHMIRNCFTNAQTQIAKIDRDCIIDLSFKIDKDSSVVNSIIGAHCVVGANCKITNCIIMDHVTIENDSIIEGSILCNNSSVHKGSKVTSCNIGAGYSVTGNHQNENLQNESVLE